ncbi:hypothetical protein RclHR1_07220013 [Rhizophagus clarus]|uniref:ATP-dependent DNA helicase PIF7-like isoform X3 n=1 Tax=Rhizophagus clarus TaxID=94130 RepID=A0A2Z6RXT6_9GLOM|nr:hypothetical protein RclHR1_07220013 [Rhizophagus clarus]GES98759.1 ATP-dependent DNA helicase PIF7-like isoform X3 [Rhizophagus clarus]
MRWRALQKGKVYVKQNLNDEQLDVAGIQKMIAGGNKQLTDQIMRYGRIAQNTTILDDSKIKESENMMNNAIQYIDSMVTTINPDINAAIPKYHPCKKRSNKIEDDSKDYIELINKLQHHTYCNPSYYARTN